MAKNDGLTIGLKITDLPEMEKLLGALSEWAAEMAWRPPEILSPAETKLLEAAG